jgi:DNA replication and repair protein RecF
VFIEKIELIDYRNYKNAVLKFNKPIVVILGMNGQGKSNILEAICFLTTKTSFRARQLKEMIRWEKDQSILRGSLRSENRVDEIEVVIEEGGAQVLRNKVKEKEWKIQREFSTVVFTPDDLQTVKGSPQKRRQYIDGVITKIKPTFVFTLINYNKVLQQKNALLKKTARSEEIEVWNDKLAELGARIIIEREVAARLISEKAEKEYKELLEEKERKSLEVAYLSTVKGRDREEIREGLIRELKRREGEERERGVTLVGPHRDDLKIAINGREARLYASQGEERSIVLALKLAEMELLREEKREEPVVLFDDVLSELDEQVKNKLMSKINGRSQVFITAASRECVPKDLFQAQWLYIEGGTFKEWDDPSGS